MVTMPMPTPQPTGEVKRTLDEIQNLLRRVEEIKQPAINALLMQKQEIDRQLAALGYNVVVPRKPGGSPDPTKPCKKCGQLGHDARFHRGEWNAAREAAAAAGGKEVKQ
jgi:hypothetical protein